MEKKHEATPRITRNEVLSLDIATHTGYYSLVESGTWNFEESMRRNNNKQHKAFRDTLMRFIKEHGIKRIVAEDVRAGEAKGGFMASRKLAEFRGILMEVCDELDMPEPTFINPSTVKKWATGDGKADKDKMVRYAKLRWGVTPVDDNHADACHIFMYYIKKMNL